MWSDSITGLLLQRCLSASGRAELHSSGRAGCRHYSDAWLPCWCTPEIALPVGCNYQPTKGLPDTLAAGASVRPVTP